MIAMMQAFHSVKNLTKMLNMETDAWMNSHAETGLKVLLIVVCQRY